MRGLVLLLVLTSPLAAQRRDIDYVLLGSSTALIVADWSQTLRMSRQQWRSGSMDATENNPLLGAHPSVGRINTLCGLAILTNLTAFALPNRSRRIWHLLVFTVETWAVTRNLSHGFAIGF